MPLSRCSLTPPSRHRKRPGVLALFGRTAEFLFYHLLISFVDRVNRLPRERVMPEAMRLYRENIALKAQLDALTSELAKLPHRPRARLFRSAARPRHLGASAARHRPRDAGDHGASGAR